MAIAQRPKRQPIANGHDKAEAFISGVASRDLSQDEQEAPKVVTTLRFDPALLKKIDAAAKRRGVSRTAYVMMAVSRAVEEGL